MVKVRTSTSQAKSRKASPAKAKSPSPKKMTTRSSPRKATPSVKVKEAEATDKVKTGRIAKSPSTKKAATKASPAKAPPANKATKTSPTKATPAKKAAAKASPAKATPNAATAKRAASPEKSTRATRAARSKFPTPAKKSSPARKSVSPVKSPVMSVRKATSKSPAPLASKSPSRSPGKPRGRPPKRASPAKDSQFKGETQQLTAKDLRTIDRRLNHAISAVDLGLATGQIDSEALLAAYGALRDFPRLMGHYDPRQDPKLQEIKAEYRLLMDILNPDFCPKPNRVQLPHQRPYPPWNSKYEQGIQDHNDMMAHYQRMTEQHALGMQQFHQGLDQMAREIHAAVGSGITPDLSTMNINGMFSPSAQSFFDSVTSDTSGQALTSPAIGTSDCGRGRSPEKARAASPAKPLTQVAPSRVTKSGRSKSRSFVKIQAPPSPGSGLAYCRSKSPAKKMARSPSKSPAPVTRESPSKSPAKATIGSRNRSKSPAKIRTASRSKSPAKQPRLLSHTNTDIFDGNDSESNCRPRNAGTQPASGQASLPGGLAALPPSATQPKLPNWKTTPALAAKSKQAGKQNATTSLKASPSRERPARSVTDGRGSVISTTNPEFIKDTKKVNPFFEKLPGPEIWHRRMPPYFPFGETPYMEAVMSRQIDEDLARGLRDEKSVDKPNVLRRAASGAASWFASWSPSRPRPGAKIYPPAWDLPVVTQEEIDEAIKSYWRSGSAAKKTKARKRSSR